jgi:hypothetical protein
MASLGRELPGRKAKKIGNDDVVGDEATLTVSEDEDQKPAAPKAKRRVPPKKQPSELPADPEQKTRAALQNIDEEMEKVKDAKATKREQKYAIFVKAYLCLLICKSFIGRFASIWALILPQVNSE